MPMPPCCIYVRISTSMSAYARPSVRSLQHQARQKVDSDLLGPHVWYPQFNEALRPPSGAAAQEGQCVVGRQSYEIVLDFSKYVIYHPFSATVVALRSYIPLIFAVCMFLDTVSDTVSARPNSNTILDYVSTSHPACLLDAACSTLSTGLPPFKSWRQYRRDQAGCSAFSSPSVFRSMQYYAYKYKVTGD